MLIRLLFPLFMMTAFVAQAELKYLVQISENLKSSDRPFAASYYLKKHLTQDSDKKFHANYEHLLGLIDLVGYSVFDDLSLFNTSKYPFAAMYYHSLKSLIFTKQFQRTIKTYQSFPQVYKNHPVFLQLAGFAAYQLNQNKLSLEYFTKCNSGIQKTPAPHFMSPKNYYLIAQQCQAYLGREFYRQKKYRSALMVYNKVDEKSYYYPNTFTEKAWSHYQLDEYESVLGLNLAFHATWLTPFYTGEIDLLATLSLIRLCRWDDVFFFLKQLHTRSNIAIANLNKIEFFLDKYLQKYLDNQKSVLKRLDPSLRRVLNRFKLNSYWDKLSSDYQTIRQEIASNDRQIIDQVDKNEVRAFLKEKQREVFLNIKKYFSNEIKSSRYELYKNKAEADALELEVYARYRNTLYRNENDLDSLSDKKQIASKNNVKKEQEEPKKWVYDQEKWRDEIGRYKINLPSLCKEVNKELPL